MPEIRTMKIVVGIMTALIVVMTALVIYGISHTASRTQQVPVVWSKALPAGVSVVSISPAGSQLAVLADTPEGRRILIINPTTGAITGTLTQTR